MNVRLWADAANDFVRLRLLDALAEKRLSSDLVMLRAINLLIYFSIANITLQKSRLPGWIIYECPQVETPLGNTMDLRMRVLPLDHGVEAKILLLMEY